MHVKKYLTTLLIGASCLTNAYASNLGSLTPQEAKIYEDLITGVKNKYGTVRLDSMDMMDSFCMAKLIDFDGDSKPEIYFVAKGGDGAQYNQWIYGFDNNGELFHESPKMTNLGTDVSPQSIFYIGDDKSYILVGNAEANGGEISFCTLNGTKLEPVFSYRNSVDGMVEEGIHEINGVPATEEQVIEAVNNFKNGLKYEAYDYYSFSLDETAATIDKTFTLLKSLTAPMANSSNSSFILNGQKVEISAYNINNNNYFKLRDLAAILTHTEKQFDVTWNGQAINLISNSEYTTVGGELDTSNKENKQSVLNQSKIYLDGQEISLTAYTIDNNNYFKLRDIAKIFNFSVTWDSVANSVIIDTNSIYTE